MRMRDKIDIYIEEHFWPKVFIGLAFTGAIELALELGEKYLQ